jgi:hypothetical protein
MEPGRCPPETFSSSTQKPIYVRFCQPTGHCVPLTSSRTIISRLTQFSLSVVWNDFPLLLTGKWRFLSFNVQATSHGTLVRCDVIIATKINIVVFWLMTVSGRWKENTASNFRAVSSFCTLVTTYTDIYSTRLVPTLPKNPILPPWRE